MNQQEVFIQMCLKAWNTQVQSLNRLVDSLDDEALLQEISPGKNSLVYLLGHLVAVNDSMIGLFGLGDRLYTHLDETFVKNPDLHNSDLRLAAELRGEWKRSNEILSEHFSKISPADWFGKHTAMTDADLEKDPARNKLSVLINRTNHLAYHLGQMVLAKTKSPQGTT